MTNQVPLLLSAEPVGRLQSLQRAVTPNVAVVYGLADGNLYVPHAAGPGRRPNNLNGRVRTRYEVDLSSHTHNIELRTMPPPAQGGVYYFQAALTIGFRVDPSRVKDVVLNDIRDGLGVVSTFLIHAVADITERFPIEKAQAAQEAVNKQFRGVTKIGGCIDLFLCRARLAPDQAAQEHLRAIETARRENTLGAARHDTDRDTTNRTNELDVVRQMHELDRNERERIALQGRPMNIQDMVMLHLERNPGDTLETLKMLAELQAAQIERDDAERARAEERLRFMVEQKLLQAVDVEKMRREALTPVMQPVASLAPAPADDDWDEPLPPSAAVSGVPSPRPPDEPALPGVIPVYVLVDVPFGANGSLSLIRDGLADLSEAVAADPRIAAVVRLGLLGCGDGLALVSPLSRRRPGAMLPRIAAAAGRSRLAPAFTWLTEHLDTDMLALKQETPSTRRPQVLLLSLSEPADPTFWPDAHRALVDRAVQRFAPDVVACGLGAAAAPTMRRLATRPELAFVAPAGSATAAVNYFFAFARDHILRYGQAVLDGDQAANFRGPAGFVPATEPDLDPR
ncbi:hypothetical protein ACQEVZ_31730 [Dactylosporangium sp. CA-152071]|uniref:hypothetical protein n=1 Tax=Dactylosporangium sp. CA-152071 TaxID=3239933 RepID=UPI003D8D881C